MAVTLMLPGADMFKSDADVLVNATNAIGIMGGGLAIHFRRRYPGYYNSYMKAHWDGKLVRGSEQYSEGYEVRTVDGRITVRHKLGGAGAANEENVRRAVRKVLRYADTLLLAGFQPRIDEGGRSLIVCARTR